MEPMIAVRMTMRERESLTWDDMANRDVPVPKTVARGRLWVTCEATAAQWATVARYADGQAEHWADDIGVTGEELAGVRRDAARCRRVAERIRSAVAGGAA